MQRRLFIAVTALLAACDPTIQQTTNPPVITARFDPSQSPPLVPVPNDLATDPSTGLLNIPVPADATPADQDFYAYLDTLDGYPVNTGAAATFDGQLKSDSVTPDDVRVYDVTGGLMKVVVAPVYMDTMVGGAAGQVSIAPPAGNWVPGHTYAVALIGGANGLKGSNNEPVVASATWALLRSKNSIVTCADLTSPDCAPATTLIPSAIKSDAAGRLADQTATALQLETLRENYGPIVDHVVSDGFVREDIALLWTFKIASFAQVVFDPSQAPPLVPVPNDLAINPATGKIVVPIDPSYSPAYQEFIRDFLDSLDGFPVSSTAQATIAYGDLDPATLIIGNGPGDPDAGTPPDNLVVLSLNGKQLLGVPNVSYDPTAKSLNISPPGGSWGKANQLAVAVLGGDTGVRVVGGGPVVASPIWALVRSTDALVDCTVDCTNPAAPGIPTGCNPAITAAPLNIDQAAGLECLRESYAPVLDALEAQGIARANVDILWTFRTTTLPEATFDPTNSIIPFPNDLLRSTGANPHLTLPVPDGGSALQTQLVGGLNTLDGFSLTAPIVSESSSTLGAIDLGSLDEATLDGGTGFVKLVGPNGAPDVRVCLNCASSPLPDGGAQLSPQQLQFVPRTPLFEQSTYAAYLTTDLKNTDGSPVTAAPTWAILRLKNPVCDTVNNKSLLPIVSDAQACAAGGLEQGRLSLKPMLDALEAGGLVRKRVALAWAFTTETTVEELSQLHDAVSSGALSALLPTAPDSIFPVPTAAIAGALPQTALATSVYLGTMELPFALTGPGNTLRPPNGWASQKASFLLTVPAGAAPAAGWPVVLFGHGLTGNHLQMIAIANTLAAFGQATIAVDVVWHGDRTTCKGAASALLQAGVPGATDDYACTAPSATLPTSPDPMHAMCDETTGRCVTRTGVGAPGADCTVGGDAVCISQHQGYCLTATHTCEGADFARDGSNSPLVNAWNFLNLANLFASRDNFRHYALDLAQVVNVLKDTTTGLSPALQAVGGPKLDPTTLNYAGQSLGGFNGALFAAVDKSVVNVALNVPGSDQELVLLTSPAFQPYRDGFLGTLSQSGINPGTPDFDNLMVLVKTIFDKCDPQNFGLTAVNIGQVANRKVFMQSIEQDFVVPNPTTDELIAASSVGVNMPILHRFSLTDIPFTTLMPADRHGFLLNFKSPASTIAAQTEVGHFILTGSPQ